MEQKNKIGIIAFVFAIIAISGATAIGTTTDFYLNLMNGSVTLLPGNNVTIDTDVLNKTITIDSITGLSISDITKVNKSGDVMTGILTVPMIDISNTSGNTRYGYLAGYLNTGGAQTAIGSNAGHGNTGSEQTAIGSNAGHGNTGSEQTAIGSSAGHGNSGIRQMALGSYAGYYNTGSEQTAIGSNAGRTNKGLRQTSVGFASGYENTGSYQTAVGYRAGYLNIGSRQTTIGFRAGELNTGNDTIFIGYEAGRNNVLHNIFILKQNNINTVPLITGNFSSGEVNIPGGNLNISKAGKGITLYSPNNSPFCTVVDDLGALTTTAGSCY